MNNNNNFKETPRATIFLNRVFPACRVWHVQGGTSGFLVEFPYGGKYWCKLRPHVDSFLKRAADLFEVVLFTAGSEVHAPVQISFNLVHDPALSNPKPPTLVHQHQNDCNDMRVDSCHY